MDTATIAAEAGGYALVLAAIITLAGITAGIRRLIAQRRRKAILATAPAGWVDNLAVLDEHAIDHAIADVDAWLDYPTAGGTR